jgi:hypothetical protein
MLATARAEGTEPFATLALAAYPAVLHSEKKLGLRLVNVHAQQARHKKQADVFATTVFQ